jgi:hypothetical protein
MENRENCKSIAEISSDMEKLTKKMDQIILNKLDVYLKEISTEILNTVTLDDIKCDRLVDVSMTVMNKHRNYNELIKYTEKFNRSDNFNKEKELIMIKWGNLVKEAIDKALREE